MTSKRIFIALPLPQTQRIASLFRSLKTELRQERIKWVDPRGLHLTLAFLGDTPAEKIPELTRRLKAALAPHAPFRLQPAALGTFPNEKRPRIIWAGMSAPPDLAALQRAVVHSLQPQFPIADLRFTPHLTLGRIKGGVQRPGKVMDVLNRYQNWIDSPRIMDRVVVMESRLTPKGPIYTPLKALILKG